MVNGFTLIELMVTVAIVALVSAFSIPSISHMVERNKVESDVYTVKNIIQTARNQAISKKSLITICGKTVDLSCSRDWKDIVVFNTLEKEIIYETQLNSSFSSVKWYAFQNKPGLAISPTGYTHHQNGSLYLCHQSSPLLHRALIVSKSGRVTIDSKSDKLQQRCSK